MGADAFVRPRREAPVSTPAVIPARRCKKLGSVESHPCAKNAQGWGTRLKASTLDNALSALKTRGIILPKKGTKGTYKLPSRSFAVWIRAYTQTEGLIASTFQAWPPPPRNLAVRTNNPDTPVRRAASGVRPFTNAIMYSGYLPPVAASAGNTSSIQVRPVGFGSIVPTLRKPRRAGQPKLSGPAPPGFSESLWHIRRTQRGASLP